MGKMLFVVICAMLCATPLLAEDGYDKMFGSLDKDSDNSLSRKEFMEGDMEIDREKAVELFPGMTDMRKLSERDLRERLFEQMDGSRNGLLSRDEWRRVAPNILIIRF